MTFSSEEVRILYHQLPTAQQTEYASWEESLAQKGRRLHIDAVTKQSNISEVVIRIVEEHNFPVSATTDAYTDHACGD